VSTLFLEWRGYFLGNFLKMAKWPTELKGVFTGAIAGQAPRPSPVKNGRRCCRNCEAANLRAPHLPIAMSGTVDITLFGVIYS